MRKRKRESPPSKLPRAAARKAPINLSTHRPAKPVDAVRGSFWEAGVDVESWYAYETTSNATFEILVDPAKLRLRTRREGDSGEFAVMTHAEFAANDAGRRWIIEVFDTTTLTEIDGEIERLTKLQDCRTRQPRRNVKDIRGGSRTSALGEWIKRLGARIAQ